IPGFPLDGGRVLRAVVWWITGQADRSTRIAAQTGQLVAFAFITLGLVRFFGGAGIGGLWIAFIGWFLLDAARVSYAQVGISAALRGVRVGDVMERDCPVVDGRSNLQTLADEYLLRTGRRCVLVLEDGRVVGLITSHEIKQVERALAVHHRGQRHAAPGAAAHGRSRYPCPGGLGSNGTRRREPVAGRVRRPPGRLDLARSRAAAAANAGRA